MAESDLACYTIKNDVSIYAPNNLRLLTPYTLVEHGDWFEDEIRWMRRWLQPGMKVLDIGANYGVYSMSAAKIVGESGYVWSVEPTPSLIPALESSILKNKFNNIEIIQKAISEATGKTKFYIGKNPELNTLEKNTKLEVIDVYSSTLDQLTSLHNIKQLDFIKIDAEGKENAILKSGRKTFIEQSPLVLCELMHGGKRNLELYESFKQMGYDCYVLAPELSILSPVNQLDDVDEKRLNIFFCKPEKAIQIEKVGLLARKPATPKIPNIEKDKFLKRYSQIGKYPNYLNAAVLESSNLKISEASRRHYAAIYFYLEALDDSHSPNIRIGSLQAARLLAYQSISHKQNHERLLTFSRISEALGNRRDVRLAIHFLKVLLKNKNPLISTEPLLSPLAEFDSVDIFDDLSAWISAAIYEADLKSYAYSFWFDPIKIIKASDSLNKSNYTSRYMKRRLSLVHRIFSSNKTTYF